MKAWIVSPDMDWEEYIIPVHAETRGKALSMALKWILQVPFDKDSLTTELNDYQPSIIYPSILRTVNVKVFIANLKMNHIRKICISTTVPVRYARRNSHAIL